MDRTRRDRAKRERKRRKTMRRYGAAGLFMGAVVSFVVVFQFCLSTSAPAFELSTARHGRIESSALKGTNVVLVFFRSTS